MLPNSPSDCHAPFTSPVAQYIWAYDESADQAEKSIGSHLALVEPDFRHNYALAQQAEFEHLWLREAHRIIAIEADMSTVIGIGYRFLEHVTPYLIPNTP